MGVMNAVAHELFHDSFNEAIRDAVKALGGSKQVAPLLWPTKGVESASRYLDDCLNQDRNAKLGPEELLTIARLARQHGIHCIADFFCQESGYGKPTPIDPQDQVAAMQQEFIASVKILQQIEARVARAVGVSGGAKSRR